MFALGLTGVAFQLVMGLWVQSRWSEGVCYTSLVRCVATASRSLVASLLVRPRICVELTRLLAAFALVAALSVEVVVCGRWMLMVFVLVTGLCVAQPAYLRGRCVCAGRSVATRLCRR